MGDVKIDLKFASEVHSGVRSNTGAVKETAISLLSGGHQPDVYYCINLQVDMGINMGMYNGLTRHGFLTIRTKTLIYKASFSNERETGYYCRH